MAFTQSDVAAARIVEEEQEMVVLRYATFCQDIIEIQSHLPTRLGNQEDPSFLQRIPSFLWIAHKLAEIATTSLHMCQRIIFIVEG